MSNRRPSEVARREVIRFFHPKASRRRAMSSEIPRVPCVPGTKAPTKRARPVGELVELFDTAFISKMLFFCDERIVGDDALFLTQSNPPAFRQESLQRIPKIFDGI